MNLFFRAAELSPAADTETARKKEGEKIGAAQVAPIFLCYRGLSTVKHTHTHARARA